MTNTLIFDIEISGHHSEYLGHLINYISGNEQSLNFIFIVHPDFSKEFPELAAIAYAAYNIQLIEIDQVEYENTRNGSILKRSLAHYKLVSFYAEKFKASEVVLMSFNIFQLALSFSKQNYTIKGILFQPFFRMEKSTIKNRLQHLRKSFQTLFFLRNRSITKIFVLNDHFTVEFLNKKFDTHVFEMLPDPVPMIQPEKDFLIRAEHKINNSKKIFLHIGSLSERKGTFEILNAIMQLEEEILKSFAVILIGKAEIGTDSEIREKLQIISRTKPTAQIIYRNEFIKDARMKAYFDQSDYILMPYKNIEASSGILGHAIASGKPVVATNKGLIGELVARYNSGYLIPSSSVGELIKTFNFCMIDKRKFNINNEYINHHSINQFASCILK